MTEELITDLIGMLISVIAVCILFKMVVNAVKEDYQDFKNKLKELRRDKSS